MNTTSRPMLYRLGAYVVYPALAAAGGLLLSRADSTASILLASLLMLAALILPAFLGAYCRRCGERFLSRSLRLIVMPAAVAAALAFRGPRSSGQYLAIAMIALSVVSFAVAWRWTADGVRDPGRTRT